MKPQILLLFVAISAIAVNFTSCKKIGNRAYVTADSMILRHHGGYGPGIVASNYMINNAETKKDTTYGMGNWESEQYQVSLEQSKHDQVVFLLEEVPKRLLKNNGKNYNSTSVQDCGHTSVIAFIDGERYEWSFYECTDGMPGYAREFAEKTQSAARVLRD